MPRVSATMRSPIGAPLGVGVHLGAGLFVTYTAPNACDVTAHAGGHRKISDCLAIRSDFKKSNQGRVGVRE